MEANRILDKYCTEDKVQVMFSNAPNQVILSKDGYLYLRDADTTIHRYLSDPQRKKMPYASNPSSQKHATHLFKYNQIYVKFTCDRHMRANYDRYGNVLSFLYFYKNDSGETLLAELFVKDLEAEDKTTRTLTQQELNKFLYSIYKLDAKCIFSTSYGIKYVKCAKESLTIQDNNFLDISYEGIVNRYNKEEKAFLSMVSMMNENNTTKIHKDVTSIKDIANFVLVPRGFLEEEPYLVTLSGNAIEVYSFAITFVAEDCFELKTKKYTLDAKGFEKAILNNIADADYTDEPDFDEHLPQQIII